MEPARGKVPWRRFTLSHAAARAILCLCVLGWIQTAVLPLGAQAVPPGKDMGVGYCPKHKLNFKGWTCPKCKEEMDQQAVPIPDTSDPDADRRAREAQAERKRQLEQENARVAKEEKDRQAKFARERDARAKQLKGAPDSGLSQLKGVAGSGSSGPKGGGFDSGSSGLKGMGGPGQGTAPHTDSSVVDARVPRDGAFFTNQVPELKNSPAVDRISKGFQAVVNHDWPVALAWWKEALKRDPDNKALQRSVDLAQWMVDRPKPKAPEPVKSAKRQPWDESDHGLNLGIHVIQGISVSFPTLAPQLAPTLTTLRDMEAKEGEVDLNWWWRIQPQMRQVSEALDAIFLNSLTIGDDHEAQLACDYRDLLSRTLHTGRGQPFRKPGPTAKRAKP